MTDFCATAPQGTRLASSMIHFVDCQVQILGSGAWAALSAPGSILTVVLTGFLTIFIALIGYNLLLGTVLTVREATLAFVKIGAVFALATSWPAYSTLVYDLTIDGPAQLMAEIGPRAGLAGADGTLLQRIDLVDQGLAQIAVLGTGAPPPGSRMEIIPPPFGGFDAFALGGARIVFLLTAVAGLAAVRIVIGLMLALGPFFIAFLLFDSTRSLFEGWVRVIGGAAIATIGVSIALGLELALIGPWLSSVLARRMAGEALPTMPTELFVLVSFFTIVVISCLFASLRTMRAFRLAPIRRMLGIGGERHVVGSSTQSEALTTESLRSEVERSRAAVVAGLLANTARREGSAPLPDSRLVYVSDSSTRSRSDGPPTVAPVGRTFARRATSRISARATRRDLAS